jgi:fatty-acyl-CoA synthase
MEVFREILAARAGDPHPALRFEERSWGYAELVQASAQRAAWLLGNRRPGPLHVGVLLDNVPDFAFWVGAAALAGGVVVGINPTRRGAELARDIRHTDCQLIVTESRHLGLLDGLDLGVPAERILDVDTPDYAARLEPWAQAPLPDVPVAAGDTLLLLFTSGTSGAPKAVICTQGKLAAVAQLMVKLCHLDRSTVTYVAMPLFHSNGLFTGMAPTLAAGGTAVLRRRFSASLAMADIRRYGCTYFNYVGRPLSYILAQPERPDDADNPLKLVFGNEGADLDVERFSRRFQVKVVDAYGSTETGATIHRVADMPPGALGVAPDSVRILDPESGRECPPAEFDAEGRLLNAEQAIGEIVNTAGPNLFEGYYRNDEANAQRMRGGMYWTGDLGYRDKQGFFYFAGRDFEWLRVDGENFSAAPLERILARLAGVILAAVYAVPDLEIGDQVMAALQVHDPDAFDPRAFEQFLSEQSDLGTKWAPRYVRLTRALPITETAKIQKRALRSQRWECEEPVWFRPAPGAPYRRLTPADAAALREQFRARGREALLI